jgi:hypothetical protein
MIIADIILRLPRRCFTCGGRVVMTVVAIVIILDFGRGDCRPRPWAGRPRLRKLGDGGAPRVGCCDHAGGGALRHQHPRVVGSKQVYV